MLSRLLVPDTVDYMIAGYVVISVSLVGYLASLALRWRKAAAEYRSYQKDIENN
jgi:hypothetical protein